MSQLSTEPEPKPIRMNLNIDAKLHQQFKVATVLQGKRMSNVLLEFIHKYVEQHYPKDLSSKKGGRG